MSIHMKIAEQGGGDGGREDLRGAELQHELRTLLHALRLRQVRALFICGVWLDLPAEEG